MLPVNVLNDYKHDTRSSQSHRQPSVELIWWDTVLIRATKCKALAPEGLLTEEFKISKAVPTRSSGKGCLQMARCWEVKKMQGGLSELAAEDTR
jgi:hypothetical protein